MEKLKQLPCHNRNNFAHYQADAAGKSGHKKASVYLSTNDQPDAKEPLVITTEKTNILLRYLHQQWDKKNPANGKNGKKRESASDSEACVPKKRGRVVSRDSSAGDN